MSSQSPKVFPAGKAARLRRVAGWLRRGGWTASRAAMLVRFGAWKRLYSPLAQLDAGRAVLLSQIETGGVGLNVQATSW